MRNSLQWNMTVHQRIQGNEKADLFAEGLRACSVGTYMTNCVSEYQERDIGLAQVADCYALEGFSSESPACSPRVNQLPNRNNCFKQTERKWTVNLFTNYYLCKHLYTILVVSPLAVCYKNEKDSQHVPGECLDPGNTRLEYTWSSSRYPKWRHVEVKFERIFFGGRWSRNRRIRKPKIYYCVRALLKIESFLTVHLYTAINLRYNQVVGTNPKISEMMSNLTQRQNIALSRDKQLMFY